MNVHRGVLYALGAAALFGASTPLARYLVADVHPVWLAGLLYAGSGVGLCCLMVLRRVLSAEPALPVRIARHDAAWLAAAVLCGGIIAPLLLTYGIASTTGSTASLLLNLESVLTAVIAWTVFRENRDARIVAGMVCIVVASVMLTWSGGAQISSGVILIALACLVWAIDNNLTRKVAANDALLIAAIKGLVAGGVNLTLAWSLGFVTPTVANGLAAASVGFVGYGLSLVLFVLALRSLGTARTGAYFSTATIVGVVVSMTLLHETPGVLFWLSAALMACGVFLHLTERHVHAHEHEPVLHAHAHSHDLHHQHAHDVAWDGAEPHAHLHQHMRLVHAHPHYPDMEHRHLH